MALNKDDNQKQEQQPEAQVEETNQGSTPEQPTTKFIEPDFEQVVKQPEPEQTVASAEQTFGQNYEQFHSSAEQKETVQQQTHTQTQTQKASTFMIDDINSWFNSSISPLADGGDSEIQRLIELGQATIAEKGDENLKNSVRFHPLSKTQTGSFSAIIVSMRKIVNSVPNIGVQVYIIESSRGEIDADIWDTETAGRIEIPVPTVEAYGSMMPVAVEAVRKAYNADDNARILACGVQIITREAVIRTVDEFRPFLNESVKAIMGWLNNVEGTSKPFSLDVLKADPTVRVVSRTVVTDDQVIRPNGLPVRADIITELKLVRQKNANPVRLNNELEMAKTAAFVELVYTPPGQPVYGQPPQTWYYVPRITLPWISTDITAAPLEFILLGIANATILGRNKAYGIAYRANYNNPDKVNLRDLGAVGYQVPGLAEKAGMIDISGSDTELRKLMDRVLSPNPVYTIEIEQSGLNSWLLQVIARASENTEAGQIARRQLIGAADRLTSGRFSKLLKQHTKVENIENVELVRNTHDRNVVGYYNLNGVRRDLRELDLLAILNLHGSKSPELVNDFIRTLITQNGGEDPFVRLYQRMQLIRTFVSDVTIKGYSNKYDFTGVFINTLVAAIEQTGLTVNSNTTGLRDNQTINQTAQDWASVMTNPNAGNQLFGGNVRGGYANTHGVGNMPQFNGYFIR